MSFRTAGMSKMKKAQIVQEYMPYGKVLVVDDMETNLYVAKGFLLPYGLTVDTALSGAEAMEKIERGGVYDIVFMDHMMPGMDGIETVKAIREKGYTRPIVALTANAVLGQADKFIANGFDGFISKPVDIRELNAALNKFVRDTGRGMTEAQLQKLFDAYSRFNMEENRFVEGTGLGMNIVQHLVEKTGGDISVNSVPGEGTEMTVYLPQGYAGPAKLGKELAENLMSFRTAGMSKMKKAQIVREHMPYGRALVVDDMETNLYVAKGFLLPYGLTVDTALSGKDAVEKIERGNVYDIVFMDHMMPGMDGIETVKAVRAKGYTSPIVALTANAVSGQADKFMANGFDGFISKPIDIRELNASLNKFVRDRQPPEAVEAARAASDGGVVTGSEAPQADPELARIFTHDAEKAIAVLQGYEAGSYESDNLQDYIMNVHAIKSALANIGETKLSNFAKDLEQAGRDKNIAFISKETPVFLNGLVALVERLKPGKAEEGGEVTEEDRAYLHKMLPAVRDACAKYDIDAAMAVLAQRKQRPRPGKYGELIDTISGHLLHSEFDEAGAACSAYLVSP
jgi:CheY-like chemotaxis protein